MSDTIHHQIFIGDSTALPEDVAAVMTEFIEDKESMILQMVALPHAQIGSKYAWLHKSLRDDQRYPALIGAIDDHLDNILDTEPTWYRGCVKGYREYFDVNCLDYHYDDMIIHIYRCSLA